MTPRETILSFDQWLALMKFVYGQTEGTPPTAVEVSGADGGPIVITINGELTRLTSLTPK